jgi:hypothetical protein
MSDDIEKIETELGIDGSIKDPNVESMANANEFGIEAHKIHSGILFYYDPTTKTTRRRFIQSWYDEREIPIEDIMKDWYEKVGHTLG